MALMMLDERDTLFHFATRVLARSCISRQRRLAMEVFEAVRIVLAVRKYQDTPVPLDIVRRIVEAGRLTMTATADILRSL